MVKLFLLLLLLFSSFSTFSQKIEPAFSLNAGIGISSSTGNEPYDKQIQGLVSGNFYGQYSFPFHFHVGLGIAYTLNVINSFNVTTPVNGEIHNGFGYLNLGYDQFLSEKFAFDFSVRAGSSYNLINSNLLKDQGMSGRVFDALYLEGIVGLILAADEKSSFRLNLGYGIQGYSYDETFIGLPTQGAYSESQIKKPVSFFTIGFGYTYYLSSKSK